MRLDLSQYQPGAYVVFNDSPPWDIVKKAYHLYSLDPEKRVEALTNGEEGDEFVKAIFQTMIDEWNLKDRKGNLITPTDSGEFPVDNLGRKLDGRIVSAIFGAAQQVINGGVPDPNSVSAS